MCKKVIFLSSCLLSLVFSGCRVESQPAAYKSNTGKVPKVLTEKNFLDVCNGSKVDGAASFDKTAGTKSPIFIFYQKEASQSYRNDGYSFPDDWKDFSIAIEKTQLVACISVSERKERKICPFEEDGKKYKLKLNDAKFNVKVYEAQTGTIVAERDFDLKASKECPWISFFTDSEASEDPDYKQSVTNFLKPFVNH